MIEKRRFPEKMSKTNRMVEKKLFKAQNSTKSRYNRQIGGKQKKGQIG